MMKFQKIVLAFAFISFLAVGCKKEAKKEDVTKEQKTEIVANVKELSLNISGMTCEIGCARKIASDLSKKEGVLEANVIFNDSIANVKYDANITNKADLIAFVEGIGSGDMYKVSQTSKKACASDCKKACCSKSGADKKACSQAKGDKKACAHAKAGKKACASDCKKACCAKKDADKKACATDCKKECCTKKA